MTYQVEIGGRRRTVELTATNGGWRVQLDGDALPLDAIRIDAGTLSLLIAGRSYTFVWECDDNGTMWVGSPNLGHHFTASVADPRRAGTKHGFEPGGRAQVKAPMAGKVVKLLAALGTAVERGQGLVVLEAMKMQNEVRSPKSGLLAALPVAAGAAVATGQILAEIE